MSVVSLLSQADIFDELTPTQLELIGSICAERHYQASDVIFEENTPGDEMYIIASGEVQIQVVTVINFVLLRSSITCSGESSGIYITIV